MSCVAQDRAARVRQALILIKLSVRRNNALTRRASIVHGIVAVYGLAFGFVRLTFVFTLQTQWYQEYDASAARVI
jgi:hypothetical protein